MGVVMSGRKRLISSVVAVIALSVAGGWLTQGHAQSNRDVIDCGRNNVPRGNVTSEETATIRLAATGLNDAADVATLSLWRDACRTELVHGRRNNLRAYMCVADAEAKIASLAPSEANGERAYCAYSAVIGLAARGNDPALRAQAHENRGGILMTLRQLSSPATERAVQLLNAAIADYVEAVRRPTASRHFALGAAYLAQNNTSAANAQIAAGAALAPASDAERRSAVRSIVNLAGGNPAPSNAADLLQTALRLDPSSASANTALGLVYASRNDHPAAAERFRSAVAGRDDTADYPGRNYMAEAHYHLALDDARNGLWTSALSRSREALRAGGTADQRFTRLVCISYIMTGWSRSDQPQDVYCSVNANAEGELLRGMYHLRRAQYLNPRSMADTNQRRAYIDAISAATRAFNSGYEMAIRSGAPDATATWQTSPEPFNVRYMLEYGRSIIAANCPYPNEQRPGRGLDQAILTSGEAFFRRHDLFACYKTQAP